MLTEKEKRKARRKAHRKNLVVRGNQLRAILTDSKNMDPDVKKVWVSSLRSGEYKQGNGRMCRVDDDGAHSFCCLGVLGDEAIDADWHLVGGEGSYRLGDSLCSNVAGLTRRQQDECGLSDEAADALTRANDGGLRFSTIADAIEECL